MLEVRCSTDVGPKLLVITYFSGIKKASEGVGQTLGGYKQCLMMVDFNS